MNLYLVCFYTQKCYMKLERNFRTDRPWMDINDSSIRGMDYF